MMGWRNDEVNRVLVNDFTGWTVAWEWVFFRWPVWRKRMAWAKLLAAIVLFVILWNG